MPSRTREDSKSQPIWRTTPPRIVTIFLLAVFFLFASFGFVYDASGMGRQSVLHLVLSVGVHRALCHRFPRGGPLFSPRWWIGVLPLLVVQNVCMNLLGRWLPDAPPLTQLDSIQLSSFHHRLVFDGVAVTTSVVLGYMGFIIVSIAKPAAASGSKLKKLRLKPNWQPPGNPAHHGSRGTAACSRIRNRRIFRPAANSAETFSRSSRSETAKPS